MKSRERNITPTTEQYVTETRNLTLVLYTINVFQPIDKSGLTLKLEKQIETREIGRLIKKLSKEKQIFRFKDYDKYVVTYRGYLTLSKGAIAKNRDIYRLWDLSN